MGIFINSRKILLKKWQKYLESKSKVRTFALAKRKTAVPQWRSGSGRDAPEEILKKLAKRFARFRISA